MLSIGKIFAAFIVMVLAIVLRQEQRIESILLQQKSYRKGLKNGGTDYEHLRELQGGRGCRGMSTEDWT